MIVNKVMQVSVKLDAAMNAVDIYRIITISRNAYNNTKRLYFI